MKKIVITPAGRERYLEILAKYIQREIENGTVDKWHLWVNTNVESDINYLKKLELEFPWVKLIKSPVEPNWINSLPSFWEIDTVDPDAIYIRLDDDICYLAPDCISNLIKFRIENPHYSFISGNLINNSLSCHLMQRMGVLDTQFNGFCEYDCMSSSLWRSARSAEYIHNQFLLWEDRDTKPKCFERWVLGHYEQISINCLCFLGLDIISMFEGKCQEDEEPWLTTKMVRAARRPICICGSAVASHFAFYTQRKILDGTNILERYKKLAEQVC